MARIWTDKERKVAAVGTLVVAIAFTVFAIRPYAISDLDERVCDLLTGWAGGGHPSGRVAVVAIDEESLALYGRWPWHRDRLAQLVQRTAEQGAATIVLDAMFPEQDGNEAGRGRSADLTLAAALADHRTVLGYEFGFDTARHSTRDCEISALSGAVVESPPGLLFRASDVVCSIPELTRAAQGSGFLNAAPDRDGKLRRVPVLIEYKGRYFPSLALAALSVFRPSSKMRFSPGAGGAFELKLDPGTVRLEGPAWLRLRFRGPARTLPYISAAQIMAGAPGRELQGKVAVIGVTAPGLDAASAVPTASLFPAVETQATAIDNLLSGDAWSRPGAMRLWELVLLAAAGVISTLSLALGRSYGGALTTTLLVVCTVGLSALVATSTGILLSPLPVIAIAGCNYSVLTLLNYLLERRHAEVTERQLVSARAYTETALARREERYRQLVDNVNDAIIMDDAEGRLVFANRRFREWCGFVDADTGKKMLEDYVPPEWREFLRERRRRLINGEEGLNQFEFEALKPDGTRIWIEALVTTIQDEGRVSGTQSALRDVTERKRIEAQYLQAQKMESIGRLAGGIAHDFNNLLTVINGYGAMLLDELESGHPTRAYAEQIAEAGERATELTRNLLAFSRKQLLQLKLVDVSEVVTNAEKMFRRVLGEDVELVTQLSPSVWPVACDPSQIHQVLMNLVVNSRDSMPDGGTLTIAADNVEVDGPSAASQRAAAPGCYVRLSVRDTGCGMTEEVQRHIFEPFFTTKAAGQGTGLGLATVYGIVRQSGGFIRVETAPGHGTAFHVYLPRCEHPELVAPATRRSETALSGSETVLLVEDQDAVRELAGNVLQRYGYRVLWAASGPQALALAASYSGAIDLLLTDVVLPQMNGRILADELRRSRPGLSVLYISGYPDEVLASRGVLDRDIAYVAKPFTADGLAARVRETLQQQSPGPR